MGEGLVTEAEKQRHRDAVALKARFWLSGLVVRFRPTSLEDLARVLEPNLRWQGKFANEPYRSNKYRAYHKGERSPRLSLVRKIEAIRQPDRSGEGSQAEFEHMIWEVLRGQPASAQTCRRWLHSLSAEVQAIARKAPALLAGKNSSYWIPALRPLEFALLRHRADLDALALLTFVVQQAHRFGHPELAHMAGRELVQMLWQLSIQIDDRGLLKAFMEIFEKWILPLTCKGGIRLALGDNVIARAELLRLACEVRVAERNGSRDDSVARIELRRILNWQPWLDLPSLYSARCVPMQENHLTDKEQLLCNRPPNNLEIQLRSHSMVSMLAARRERRAGSGFELE
ncbi:hypothetical protein ACGLHS_16985 [Variovorax sp. VaC1]|uniref:hypothetical protein n=1 Tax=Variovorax sp. VaC1 TaxID=3373132 RepID=UPI003748CCD3